MLTRLFVVLEAVAVETEDGERERATPGKSSREEEARGDAEALRDGEFAALLPASKFLSKSFTRELMEEMLG